MIKKATSKSTLKKKKVKMTCYYAKISSYCPVLEGANEYI